MSQRFLRFSSLLLLVSIPLLSAEVFAQKITWRYVRTIYGGVKVYLNDEVTALSNKHLVVWDKRLNADNSFAVSKVEWDCLNKIHLTLEMTMYKADQTVIGTIKKFEWKSIVPGSVADVMYQQICIEKPKPQFVEIIADNTNLLLLPLDNAKVLKIAKKGSKFVVLPETADGGWVNIIDEKTQQDYWVRVFEIRLATTTSNSTQRRKRAKQ